MQKRVANGTRTRDPRDHNPVLYQLSYDHHSAGGGGTPHRLRRTIIATDLTGPSSGFRRVGVAYNSEAMAFACSTSGPGRGTKIVRR